MKMEALVRSVRYAFRALRRAPGFTHHRSQKS